MLSPVGSACARVIDGNSTIFVEIDGQGVVMAPRALPVSRRVPTLVMADQAGAGITAGTQGF
ncbi:hypothetical protein KH5H1_00450 [Corallococcus caeni]|nr:hypothetical protein KH5H1_00450 [Corallococcus sp. KH5-1]